MKTKTKTLNQIYQKFAKLKPTSQTNQFKIAKPRFWI